MAPDDGPVLRVARDLDLRDATVRTRRGAVIITSTSTPSTRRLLDGVWRSDAASHLELRRPRLEARRLQITATTGLSMACVVIPQPSSSATASHSLTNNVAKPSPRRFSSTCKPLNTSRGPLSTRHSTYPIFFFSRTERSTRRHKPPSRPSRGPHRRPPRPWQRRYQRTAGPLRVDVGPRGRQGFDEDFDVVHGREAMEEPGDAGRCCGRLDGTVVHYRFGRDLFQIVRAHASATARLHWTHATASAANVMLSPCKSRRYVKA